MAHLKIKSHIFGIRKILIINYSWRIFVTKARRSFFFPFVIFFPSKLFFRLPFNLVLRELFSRQRQPKNTNLIKNQIKIPTAFQGSAKKIILVDTFSFVYFSGSSRFDEMLHRRNSFRHCRLLIFIISIELSLAILFSYISAKSSKGFRNWVKGS